MGWTFLHPALLLGLGALVLPVLIHLIGRHRAPTVRFAAFDFLLAANQRLARRERLRQILLLVLRTLALAALVFAVARPIASRPAAAPAASKRVALVVDTSGSMAYETDGTSLFERAKRQAKEALTHVAPGDAATVVLAGAQVRTPLAGPTIELAAVRSAIDSAGGPAGVADLGAAIDTALGQLGTAGAGATVVVVSDLAQNSFRHLRPTALDPAPRLRLIDAAERRTLEPLPNSAIMRVGVEPSPESANERVFRVAVHNYGPTPVSARPLELVLDGAVTQRAYVDVPARGEAEKVLTHTFAQPGVYAAEVRLTPERDDGYPMDDAARAIVHVTAGVRVLAVDGDPRTVPHEDELFFVERALTAVPKGQPAIELKLVTLDEFVEPAAAIEVGGYDVVILTNIGLLPDARVAALKGFVARGGGLLVTLGDRVRFEQANEQLRDLLVHPLRDLHRAADRDAGTPPLGLGDIDWDHPVLAGLGAAAEESLRASRTSSYFNLDVGASARARTLLRFDNGAPALLERPLGEGRLMLLATSIDMDLSDLALRSVFPPLLQRVVRYLARAVETIQPADVRVGGSADIPVPTGAQAMALSSPSGKRRGWQLEAAERRVHVAELEEAGLYRVDVRRGEWKHEPALDLAVNPSLAESDFAPVDPAKAADTLSGTGSDAGVLVAAGASGDGDPFRDRGIASYLLAIVVLLLVGESTLASRG